MCRRTRLQRKGESVNLFLVRSQNQDWIRPSERATRKSQFLRFNGSVERDPAIARWMKRHEGVLGAIARQWFEVMRKCGDEVRELMHDGCPVACLGDAPFCYVNVFTSHVNVGFFHGAALPDPASLLEGSGRFMRHVKLRPGTPTNEEALGRLIENAYADIKGTRRAMLALEKHPPAEVDERSRLLASFDINFRFAGAIFGKVSGTLRTPPP